MSAVLSERCIVCDVEVRFKEHFYGYTDALSQWRRLAAIQHDQSVHVADYLQWWVGGDSACVPHTPQHCGVCAP